MIARRYLRAEHVAVSRATVKSEIESLNAPLRRPFRDDID